MPRRQAKPCSHAGCANTQPCAAHPAIKRARPRAGRYTQTVGSSAQRGYDRQWRKVRDAYMAEHAMCERCNTRRAEECHHRVPIAQAPHLRLDTANLEALCRSCHKQADNDLKAR